MADDWTSRLGTSSAATTPLGQAPVYGMAWDLATGRWTTSQQFNDFAEEQVRRSNSTLLSEAEQRAKTLHARELERARTIEETGWDADEDASWFNKILSVPKSAFNSLHADVDNLTGKGDDPEDRYKSYRKKGGLLSREEFESFSEETQRYLMAKARNTKDLETATSAPVISQALAGMEKGYRGAITATRMNTYVLGGHDYTAFLSDDKWAKAWRESADMSLGDAIVRNILTPTGLASDKQMAEWAKHSSFYQFTALGAELGVGWFAAPEVIAGKSVGATARMARHEQFLNEGSKANLAMQQALRREQITVREPIARVLGQQRAHSWIKQQERVEEFMRHATLAQASGHAPVPGLTRIKGGKIGMFGGRTINGDAAASALWHATRIADETGDRTYLDLTWRALYGEADAFAQIKTLQKSAAEDLRAFDASGEGQTVLDAYEAVKTKASLLESEAADLQAKIDNGEEPEPILQWVNDRSLELKKQDLAKANELLSRYKNHATWYNSILSDAPAPPRLSRVDMPMRAVWGAKNQRLGAEDAIRGPKSRFFMDNQYGLAHSFFKVPKAAFEGWKAPIIEAHNIESGPLAFERQTNNLVNIFGYDHLSAGLNLEKYIQAWHNAPNERERINVAAAFENEVVIGAVAQHYNRVAKKPISEDTIRRVYQHVVKKQNEMIARLNEGHSFGDDPLYAPKTDLTTQQRAETPGESIQLVKEHEDGRVELALMDRGHVQTILIPKEQWAAKPLHDGTTPIFETQTSNYYNPIDAWRFHAELQSNPALLEELEVSLAREVAASAYRGMDAALSAFNGLWKPLTLLRLGWPMRVLIDEQLRALSVLGIVAWSKHYLLADARFAGRVARKGVVGAEHLARRFKPKPLFTKDEFPVRTQPRRTPLGLPREEPRPPAVPESFLPNPDPGLRARLREEAAAWREWERMDARRRADALERGEALDPNDADMPGAYLATGAAHAEGAEITAPRVWDEGRQKNSGFFVPLPHTELSFQNPDRRIRNGVLMRWQEKWSDLLADPNYFAAFTADGKVVVGRHFPRAKSGDAAGFLRYIHDEYDGTEMWDLGSKEPWRYQDADDDAPLYREVAARLASPERRSGYGLTVTLGEDLGPEPYALKAGGKRLKVWDADHEVTEQQRADLRAAGLPEADTWADLIEDADVRDLLRGKYGVGAIRRGGEFTFLREDLRVMPLYAEGQIGRKWFGLDEWFDHPVARERIPESRIVRGEPNPLDRGLALPAPRDELAEFDGLIDDPEFGLFRRLRSRRESGKGFLTLKTSDGKKTKFMPNAYEGHLGEIMHGLVSSENTFDILSEGHGRATNWLRQRAVGFETYHAPEFTDDVLKPGTRAHKQAAEYFGRWADMVNDFLGNSPVVQKMIRGESDQQIADWLRNTEEGVKVRRMMLHEEDIPELWVNEVRSKLDKYVPSRELQRRLGEGRLKPSELRKYVAIEDMPDVIGPELEMIDGRFAGKRFLGAIFDKLWHALGTAPTDALSRQPFYKAMYELKARNLVKTYKGSHLTPEMQEILHKQAHAFAMSQMKRTLWSLVDQTNFAGAMRFIAPFWAAQREAIAKWSQIVSDRPETVGRFLMGQRAAYNNLVILNEEGEREEVRKGIFGVPYNPTDRVVMQIPRFLENAPLVGEAVKNLGEMRIPIGSMNTAMQGENPILPGLGPIVTIPVDKALRVQDDLGVPANEDGYYGFLHNWVFPIGRPRAGGQGMSAVNPLSGEFWNGVASQVLPGWAKRIQETSPGLTQFNNYMLIARQMEQDAYERGEEPPTPEEIQQVANSFTYLKIGTGLFSPFQIEWVPRDQKYLDEYHQMQREFGPDADEKFLEKHGVEYARFVTSSSNSPVGAPATSKGLSEAIANKDLLQKYGEPWGTLMASPDAWSDDFSQDAYSAEFQIPLGPGSSTKLRESNEPLERRKMAERMAGWYEYRKLNNAINAELHNRGLTNILQKGAEDLRLLKQGVVEGTQANPEGLAEKYPAWFEDYNQGQRDIYAKIRDLKGWVYDKRFDKRVDLQGVRKYLALREQVTERLDAYYVQTQGKGSRNLQAEENGALRQWFYDQVGQLILDNPAFGEVYVRYLEGDTLTKGSGGF